MGSRVPCCRHSFGALAPQKDYPNRRGWYDEDAQQALTAAGFASLWFLRRHLKA